MPGFVYSLLSGWMFALCLCVVIMKNTANLYAGFSVDVFSVLPSICLVVESVGPYNC